MYVRNYLWGDHWGERGGKALRGRGEED
jgi:hypothetical protein